MFLPCVHCDSDYAFYFSFLAGFPTPKMRSFKNASCTRQLRCPRQLLGVWRPRQLWPCVVLDNFWACAVLGNFWACAVLGNCWECVVLDNCWPCAVLNNFWACAVLDNFWACAILNNFWACAVLDSFWPCVVLDNSLLGMCYPRQLLGVHTCVSLALLCVSQKSCRILACVAKSALHRQFSLPCRLLAALWSFMAHTLDGAASATHQPRTSNTLPH